jgi:hypothetical protein
MPYVLQCERLLVENQCVNFSFTEEVLEFMDKKTILIVYEREQVDAVEAFVKVATQDIVVVSCNYWAERDLIARGVRVHPLTDYVPAWTDFRAETSIMEDTAREWYRFPEMSFFKHRNLSIGEMVEAALSAYLIQVRGYLHILEKVLAIHADVERLIVPHSSQKISSTVGALARFEVEAFVSAAKQYAKYKNIPFETIGTSYVEEPMFFPKQSLWRTWLLHGYNAVVRFAAPRHPLKILVSDHWRNVKAIVETMDDAELVFVDRKELQQIPFKQLWKHRMRFIHPVDLISPSIRKSAHTQQEQFRDLWQKGRQKVKSLPGFSIGDFNWWDVVAPAFDILVEGYSERIIADIESIRLILEKEKINRVLIRASVSGQHHFFILGEMSRQFGVPSIEIQHGIGVGTLDPHSAFGQIHADFVAAYGPLVQKAFVRNGYEKERVVLTGSPRFDRYFVERDALASLDLDKKVSSLGLDPKKPVVFVVVPSEDSAHLLGSVDMTSYEFRDFFLSLEDIRKAIPELQLILKFRSLSQFKAYGEYVKGIFSSEGVVMEHGDAFPLILSSDFVYSPFSTLVSEAIMARKPVVLFPLKLADVHFFNSHKEGVLPTHQLNTSEAVPVSEVVEITHRLIRERDFYENAVKEGQQFLAENFTFTGDAAKLVANFLRVAKLPENRN